MGLPVFEQAPWISMWLADFEPREDVELHVISPNKFVSLYSQATVDGITYHYFNHRMPWIKKAWPLDLDSRTGFILNRLIIRHLVKRIRPDLIHIIGAENALYSSVFFDLCNRYPILIGIQGFAFMAQVRLNSRAKHRIRTEKRILSQAKYFNVNSDYAGSVIRGLNEHANIYKYPTPFKPEDFPVTRDTNKEWDCVFFGRVEPNKGIYDVLRALALVRKHKHDVNLLIIGSISGSIKTEIQPLVEKLDLQRSVTFKDRTDTREEVFDLVRQARISVLPSLNDVSPGTITESLLLGNPIVAYSVGAIDELFNHTEKRIHTVERGNVEGLAQEIMDILNDYDKARNHALRAREAFLVERQNISIADQFIGFYCRILTSSPHPR